MNETIDNLRAFATEQAPYILIALAIAVFGWLLAVFVEAMLSRGLLRSKAGRRIATLLGNEQPSGQAQAAQWVGRLGYWVVMLFVLLGLLQYVQLTSAIEPISILLNSLFGFVPRLLGASILLIFAVGLATVVRKVASAALKRWNIDDIYAREVAPVASAGTDVDPGAAGRTGDTSGSPQESSASAEVGLGKSMAGMAYWLTLLLFTPAIIGTLGLSGLLDPAREVLRQILGYLPRLASAALIAGLGWFVARVVQRLVTHGLSAMGADRLAGRLGVQERLGRFAPSAVVGAIAYALVLVPVAVAALQALRLDAVTAPASRMLEVFLDAIPAMFGAALVLLVAYVVGRLLSTAARGVLERLGFDRILPRLGLEESALGKESPSRIAGGLVMVLVFVFGLIESARMLALDTFADATENVVTLAGHLALGLLVFSAGLFVASLAANAIQRSAVKAAPALATTARLAILFLAGAVALRQMGLANEIIELAFGIAFGAVAVAAALAFGLGGRVAAASVLEQARRRIIPGPPPATKAQQAAE